MIDIIKNPGLAKYRTVFTAGHTIFTEGDDSRDLYILVSGSLDVIKGNQKIAIISAEGSLFGEMSFFLGISRTSSVRTRTDTVAYRIPQDSITAFLQEFPDAVMAIIRVLAQRLDETSRVLHGLKELCDQLPDAVLITDKDGRLLSWNTAAEELYGGDWKRMESRPADSLYKNPDAYTAYIADVQTRKTVRETVFEIPQTDRGQRFVSVSATLLYDGHHAVRGILSLSRDVTAQHLLERRYRQARRMLLSPLVLAALLAAVLFYGYPYFVKGRSTVNLRQQELRSHLARDYLMLQSVLTAPLAAGNREQTAKYLRDFFALQKGAVVPYTGILLLDAEKKVFDAAARHEHAEDAPATGSSYSGITFQEIAESMHRVLTVYRTDTGNPMGTKRTEVAFALNSETGLLGWLVLQMDLQVLKDTYDADETTIRDFRFAQ
jgi:PAS domain S-box-containing protein